MKNIILFLSAIVFLQACGETKTGQIEESGTIEVETAVISSKVTGEVVSILKDEGASVNIGDTLAIIDHKVLALQLKQALAKEKMASAGLALLLKGSRNEDKRQAFENLNQAKANFNQAEQDYQRFEKLLAEKSITQQQFDQVQTRFVIAEAQLKTAEAQYQKIRNIARAEEVQQAEASLEMAEAQTELIKLQIEDSYIIASKDGQIADCFVATGELVTPKSAIYKIANTQFAELKIYISEKNLGKVKVGQQADVTTDSYKDKSYSGKIIFISHEAEFTPKNIQTKDERTKLVFAVKIKIPNPDFELKTGMPADAVINL